MSDQPSQSAHQLERLKAAIGFFLHSTHSADRADALAARFLHATLTNLLAEVEHDLPDNAQLHQGQSSYYQLLQLPPVVWGVGDIFSLSAEPGLNLTFVLPTTTQLKTSSVLVQQARGVFGDGPFTELVSHGTAELGSVIETSGGGRFPDCRICHVVCRKPGDPTVTGFNLPIVRPFERMILPIWGRGDEIHQWVGAISKAARPESLQQCRLCALIRVTEENRQAGFELERRLIESNVLVGRQSNCGIDYPCGNSEHNLNIHDAIARFVAPSGPLTPQLYTEWIQSGVIMSDGAWRLHYQTVSSKKE